MAGRYFGRLSMYGDDAWDFVVEFAERFDVQMDRYRWYFHHGEEGYSIFPAFYRRLPKIPISLRDLVRAAQDGEWSMIYQEHEIPKHRWDLIANFILVVLLTLATIGLIIFSRLS